MKKKLKEDSIRITIEGLYNLCYHSYLRGANNGLDSVIKESKLDNRPQFDEFWKSNNKNDLLKHMSRMIEEGRLSR